MSVPIHVGILTAGTLVTPDKILTWYPDKIINANHIKFMIRDFPCFRR